ncbi:MAG: rhomboid family intramembrane serine protease [Planctomycetota bacterium]|jgi:membrane associated rhomboid family serine protease
MEYNIIFAVIAINLAYLIFRCLKNDRRGNILRIGQLLLIFFISTIPYIISFARGTGPSNRTTDRIAEAVPLVAFCIFILLPPLMDIFRQALLGRGMVKTGLFLSRLSIVLDWSVSRKRAHRLYMAQAKIINNQIEEAEVILKDILATNPPSGLGSLAVQNLISVYISNQQWENAVSNYEFLVRIRDRFFHAATFVNVVRAYGELGLFNKAENLLAELKKNPLAIRQDEDKIAEMILSALKGEVEKTREIIGGLSNIKFLPRHAPDYWEGRALLSAGRGPEAVLHFEKALTLLEKMHERNRRRIMEFVEKACENNGIPVRTEQPDVSQEPAESAPILNEALKDSAFHLSLFSPAPVVYIVILANLAAHFLVEFSGSATNVFVLIEYGAASRYLIDRGEWWRIFTASFLHYGYVHLLFNMFMIFILGRYIHGLYGKKHFLIAYVFSALTGGLSTYIFQQSGRISIGASTAILGLFGLMFVFGLRNRSLIPARFKKLFGIFILPWIFIIIGIGFVFPGIDNAGHIGGFAGGILAGLFIRPSILPGKPEKARSIALHAAYICSILLFIGGLIFVARPFWTDDNKVYLPHTNSESGVSMKIPFLLSTDKDNPGLFTGGGVVFQYYVADIVEGKEIEFIHEIAGDIKLEKIEGPADARRGYMYTAFCKCPLSDGTSFDAYMVFHFIPEPSSDRTAMLGFLTRPGNTEMAVFVSEKIADSLEFLDNEKAGEEPRSDAEQE